jgi:hypothetical protein
MWLFFLWPLFVMGLVSSSEKDEEIARLKRSLYRKRKKKGR